MIERIYEKIEKLNIYEYENAIILPRKYEENGPTWGKGGVCDKRNEFVESSFYDGGYWAQLGGKYEWKKEDEKYSDEIVVYIGIFEKHWGHFLVDMTSKLWALTDPEFRKKILNFKVAYVGEVDPDGNYLQFFEMLNIKKRAINTNKTTDKI